MDNSLFGPDVATIRDNLIKQDIDQTNNLTSTGLAGMIGGMAGRGIGQLAGMEDPRVAEAKSVKEAVDELRASGVDMNDPAAYFKKMAGIFGARGLTKQAEMAAAKALEYETKKEDRQNKRELHGMDVDLKRVGLEKAYAELARAKLKAAGKVDGAEFLEILDKLYKDASVETKTEAIKRFNETGNKDEALGLLKTKQDEKLVGTTPDGKGVYNAPNEKPYIYGPDGSKQPYFGEMKPTGTITNDMRSQSAEEAAALGDYEGGRKAHAAAWDALKPVERPIGVMRKIIDSGKLTTGTMAEKQTELKRLAATLGFPVPDNITDNDDFFDAMVTEVVLPKMKMLGGNDSEQELKVIRESTGSRKFTLNTLSQILKVMEDAVVRRNQIEEAHSKHIAAGKSRLTFNWRTGGDYGVMPRDRKPAPSSASPQPSAPPTPTESYTPSSTEIQRYKTKVKEITGKDITDEQASNALKAGRKGK